MSDVWSLTGEVLDGTDDLTKEVMVVGLERERAFSLDVLEHECPQSCVCNQRQTQQKVRKEPPETPCTFSGLFFYADSFLLCN